MVDASSFAKSGSYRSEGLSFLKDARFDSAKAGILFNKICKSENVRRKIVSLFFHVLCVANENNDNSWSVTLSNNYFRINVGKIEVFTYFISHHDDIVCNMTVCDILSAHLKNRYISTNTKNPIYISYNVPSILLEFSDKEILKLDDEVIRASDKYVSGVARKFKRSNYKKSYSPALLEFLESTYGFKTPWPAWDVKRRPEFELNPGERPDEGDLKEGAMRKVLVNAYERNRSARSLCLDTYGTSCFVCEMSFENIYGEVAKDFIHIHHLKPLSTIGKEYVIDPISDLRPVCPNCHAVLHLRRGEVPYDIAEVRGFLKNRKQK